MSVFSEVIDCDCIIVFVLLVDGRFLRKCMSFCFPLQTFRIFCSDFTLGCEVTGNVAERFLYMRGYISVVVIKAVYVYIKCI